MTKYIMNLDSDGEGSMTIIDPVNGGSIIISSDAPHFFEWRDALDKGLSVQEIREEFAESEWYDDYVEEIAQLSDRVEVRDSQLYFDDILVTGAISDRILSYYNEGKPLDRLVLFLEAVSDNLSMSVRNQLFQWIESGSDGLTIDEDGHILGLKRVDSNMRSFHRGNGKVTVNGRETVYQNSQISNEVGAVVSMERRDTDDDPNVDCSFGLHVGTREYVNNFHSNNGFVMVVKVDPADVVAVPSYDVRKFRCTRYTVLSFEEDKVDYEPLADEAVSDQRVQKIVPDAPIGFIKRYLAKRAAKQKSADS